MSYQSKHFTLIGETGAWRASQVSVFIAGTFNRNNQYCSHNVTWTCCITYEVDDRRGYPLCLDFCGEFTFFKWIVRHIFSAQFSFLSSWLIPIGAFPLFTKDQAEAATTFQPDWCRNIVDRVFSTSLGEWTPMSDEISPDQCLRNDLSHQREENSVNGWRVWSWLDFWNEYLFPPGLHLSCLNCCHYWRGNNEYNGSKGRAGITKRSLKRRRERIRRTSGFRAANLAFNPLRQMKMR